MIDQAAFALVSASALRHARWADILLVESPPLFLGLTARWLSALTRRPYVLHVADPWPDYPIELGVLRSRFAIGAARRIERWAYAGATAITTPTVGCRTFIEAQPASHGKVTIVPNGVDMSRFADPPSRAAARAELGWEPDRFTFAYVGTVGLAQGLDTLIAASSRLRSQWPGPSLPTVKVVGDGQDVDRLRDLASKEAPDIVEFVDPVPKELVPTVLAAADVGLVLLRAGRLARAALPTKLVEALAAGLPVVVSADGEASDIISNGRVGLVSPAGDSARMADSMAQIAADRHQLEEMSRRAVELVRTSYDRRVVIGTLAETLAHAARAGRRS